jgi:hypothetical protein
MRKLAIFAFFAVCYLYAGQASALGLSAGLLAGNGFKDGYNVGVGARGGITLPMNLYLGASFLYHFGTTQNTGAGDVTTNLWLLGAEGGYDLGVGPLTLRPYLGLGYAHLSFGAPDACAAGTCLSVSDSDGKVALWPGVAALFNLAIFFIGVDLRYTVLLDVEDANAFGTFATAGLTF